MRARTLMRPAVGGVATALGLSLAWPPAALAHGLVAKTDLPIPTWLFAWAAAVVLLLSFVALGILWPTPRFTTSHAKRVLRVPAVLDVLCGAAGTAAFAFVVYAGYAGGQTAFGNILPTVVFVVFWVAVPFASVLLGDVFRAFNPWRAVARATGWTIGTLAPGRRRAARPYPAWLGRWPAAVAILVFGWVELVWLDHDVPAGLSTLALTYAAVQLVAMARWGVEPWTSRGDGFAVAFNLFARLAPLDWRDGWLRRRPPLEGVVGLDPVPGTVALLSVMIGATTFDGASQGPIWLHVAGPLQDAFTGLGCSTDTAVQATGTVGLLAAVLLVAALYLIGIAGVRSVSSGRDMRQLSGAFVHTLVPIAFAYLAAHYFSLLVFNGQTFYVLLSDPLGTNADYFGTATYVPDYAAVGATTIWYVQVAALVMGHVGAIVLAHDRALTLFRHRRDALRSQYWMVTMMVGFTCMGLWLLSQ